MILDTRPACYRAQMAAAYADTGCLVLQWPVLTPRALAPWPDPAPYDAVVFTSRMAVSLTPPGWTARTAYAVGESTAKAAREAGFSAVVCTGHDGAEMVEALASAPFRRAFYPSARHVSVDLAAAFPGRVDRDSVYDMIAADRVPEPVAAVLRRQRMIAPLFSRRSAAILGRLLGEAAIDATVDAVCISAAVGAVGPAPWRRTAIAAAPTLAAVAAEVLRLAQEEIAA
jgi:uroporphyrinogen-III synthase